MHKFLFILCCTALAFSTHAQSKGGEKKYLYKVHRLQSPITIDGNWKKKAWKNVRPVSITNFIREVPEFKPTVQAKMQYDDENVYVIFQVHDKYVRCINTNINGHVWEDAAVELFFCPDSSKPLDYFNLEINCGGTALFEFRKKNPPEEVVKTITIAHSMPVRVDPEIPEPVVWTIEYKIPLSTLEKYAEVTRPAKGVQWKANFYKIAENNSNPHHIAWSPITAPKPHFHMPKYFGTLEFQ